MGMQIHFNILELVQAGIKVEYVKNDPVEGYQDSFTAQFNLGEADHIGCAVPVDLISHNAWQDIGRCDNRQVALIKFLIQNRICFNAS